MTIEKVRQRAESDAKTYGYYLNPNADFLQDLLDGLRRNEERYGYPSCPCRLASGKLELDRDISAHATIVTRMFQSMEPATAPCMFGKICLKAKLR